MITDIRDIYLKRDISNAFSDMNCSDLVKMAAAYSLGIASSEDSIDQLFSIDELQATSAEADKNVIGTIMLLNSALINYKIEEWSQYGNIIAVKRVKLNNHEPAYIWLLTDQRVLIIAAITKDLKHPSELFGGNWSLGDNGISTDTEIDFSEIDFIKASPNTLVIDGSINRFSFSGFREAFQSDNFIYRAGFEDAHEYYCASLKWVKKIILPEKIQFFCNGCKDAYNAGFDQDIPYDEYDDYINYKKEMKTIYYSRLRNFYCGRPDMFSKGIELSFANKDSKPYYMENNIIYSSSDGVEVYCLNSEICEKRFYEEFIRGFRDLQCEWSQNGLCRHCGGELKGFFNKKCTICGRKRGYTTRLLVHNKYDQSHQSRTIKQ